jgi:hypothetical protein
VQQTPAQNGYLQIFPTGKQFTYFVAKEIMEEMDWQLQDCFPYKAIK